MMGMFVAFFTTTKSSSMLVPLSTDTSMWACMMVNQHMLLSLWSIHRHQLLQQPRQDDHILPCLEDGLQTRHGGDMHQLLLHRDGDLHPRHLNHSQRLVGTGIESMHSLMQAHQHEGHVRQLQLHREEHLHHHLGLQIHGDIDEQVHTASPRQHDQTGAECVQLQRAVDPPAQLSGNDQQHLQPPRDDHDHHYLRQGPSAHRS